MHCISRNLLYNLGITYRRGLEGASVILTSVRVSLIGFHTTSGNDVLVSSRGISTVTSFISTSLVAINNLLWGEGGQSVSSEEPSGFNGFSGGESPAAESKVSLVQNGLLSYLNSLLSLY